MELDPWFPAAQREESTVQRLETSKTDTPDERKLELAKVRDVKPSQLMGWD